MGIGTSMGAYYDDAFHQATARWNDKYDDNIINPEPLNPNRFPGESPSPLTDDMNTLHPENLYKQLAITKDPKLIYDDQNNIVDYAPDN